MCFAKYFINFNLLTFDIIWNFKDHLSINSVQVQIWSSHKNISDGVHLFERIFK